MNPHDLSTILPGAERNTEETLPLLEAAKLGDQVAKDRLLRRIRPGLEIAVGIESRKTAGVELRAQILDASEDILQDALLRGVESIDRVEHQGPGSVFCYFRQIMLNGLHDLRTRLKTQKRDVRRQRSADGVAAAQPGAGPATVTELEERRQFVITALMQLSEADREIVMLRFYTDASWAEVARLTGAPSESAAAKAFTNRVMKNFLDEYLRAKRGR